MDKESKIEHTSTSHKLFNLYKREKVKEIPGVGDEKIPILFRKLNSHQSKIVRDYYEDNLYKIKKKVYETKKADVEREIAGCTKEQLINLILESEVGAVFSILDFFPIKKEVEEKYREENKDKTEDEIKEGLDKYKEEKGIELFKERRLKQLNEDTEERLKNIYVTQSLNLVAVHEAIQQQILYTLVYMCLDPETKQPIFSINEKDENYIGDLEPETLEDLKFEADEFTLIKNDKDVREVTNSSDF